MKIVPPNVFPALADLDEALAIDPHHGPSRALEHRLS